MNNTLVYITDPKIPGGGYADRITGMAFLYRLAKSFNCDFKIHFNHPFEFFEAFPEQHQHHLFDINLFNSERNNIKVFNLIDDNFIVGIDDLCKSLITKCNLIALVFVNNIKPFIFDPLLNNFIHINHIQKDIDEIERSVLFEFGSLFLQPNLNLYSSNVISTASKLNEKTIGLQIRIGGMNIDWIDPLFNIPDNNSIFTKLRELEGNFSQIYISSDNLEYKLSLLELLQPHYNCVTLDEKPLHLERSTNNHNEFISRTLGDHLLLRMCSEGVIISGGGYGRTAAIISGTQFFRI